MTRRIRPRTGTSPRTATLCICVALLAGCASFSRCGPKECTADARISAEVRELFSRSPALQAPTLIDVQTVHGTVYLRGVVSTPYQVEEAASVAAQARGVARVQNLLTIDNSR